jgi:hypothetical protein
VFLKSNVEPKENIQKHNNLKFKNCNYKQDILWKRSEKEMAIIAELNQPKGDAANMEPFPSEPLKMTEA